MRSFYALHSRATQTPHPSLRLTQVSDGEASHVMERVANGASVCFASIPETVAAPAEPIRVVVPEKKEHKSPKTRKKKRKRSPKSPGKKSRKRKPRLEEEPAATLLHEVRNSVQFHRLLRPRTHLPAVTHMFTFLVAW